MNRTVFSIGSLLVMVAACVVSGYLMGRSTSDSPETAESTNQISPELQEIILKADTAASGSKIAMATASIDGDIDIIFTLDYESGNLFAWLPGPAGFLGEWSINVSKAVGLEKGGNPDLVLSVGNFNISARSKWRTARRTTDLLCCQRR